MMPMRTTPSQAGPATGRRSLLRLAVAAGAAILTGCGGGDPGAPRPVLNLKRDLNKDNGGGKRG